MEISKLKLNPKNPRTIKDEKFRKLCKSIQDFPEMMDKRPMVCVTDPVDGKLFPLGGNMRLKAIKELKFKEVPDSWISIADDWTEEKRAEFTIKDNVGFGDWNFEELAVDWDGDLLAEWGLDMPKGIDEIDVNDLFSIEIPFYTPSDEMPSIKDLAITDKADNLIEIIEGMKIDDDLKKILKFRASFFVDFNFQKIADFYYNSNDDLRKLFDSLGLVVLAPKKALENGFIEISENIDDL